MSSFFLNFCHIFDNYQDFVWSNFFCNYTCDQQIRLLLHGCLVFFFNNLHDYRLNWTLISPITFIITEQNLLSNYFDMMHKLS